MSQNGNPKIHLPWWDHATLWVVILLSAGLATAAGCQLVATCDIAVASTGSHFATPG